MKANRKKLMLAMARACMDTEDLQKAAEMPRPTLNNKSKMRDRFVKKYTANILDVKILYV